MHLSLCVKKIIIHEFRAGEENKHVGTVEDIYETLIVNKFDRNDMLLALGGGVTGDNRLCCSYIFKRH